MDLRNQYDQFANEYAGLISSRDKSTVGLDLIRHLLIPRLLSYVGDVAGMNVLDAGCGEGRITRRRAPRKR